MTDLVLILLLSAPVCISQLWVKAAEQWLAETLLKKTPQWLLKNKELRVHYPLAFLFYLAGKTVHSTRVHLQWYPSRLQRQHKSPITLSANRNHSNPVSSVLRSSSLLQYTLDTCHSLSLASKILSGIMVPSLVPKGYLYLLSPGGFWF